MTKQLDTNLSMITLLKDRAFKMSDEKEIYCCCIEHFIWLLKRSDWRGISNQSKRCICMRIRYNGGKVFCGLPIWRISRLFWRPSFLLKNLVYMNLVYMKLDGPSSDTPVLFIHQNPRDLTPNKAFLVNMNSDHFRVHLELDL